MEPPSSQIYPIASVPHGWLFPQMAAARLLMEVLEPSEPAVWDVAMRQRAKQLGQHIRAEDGVARAVETFEQIIVQQNNRKRRHKRATGYVPL